MFSIYLILHTIPNRDSQVALVVKNPPANSGDVSDAGSIPRLGRSPEEGNGWATVHGVIKSQTRLND